MAWINDFFYIVDIVPIQPLNQQHEQQATYDDAILNDEDIDLPPPLIEINVLMEQIYQEALIQNLNSQENEHNNLICYELLCLLDFVKEDLDIVPINMKKEEAFDYISGEAFVNESHAYVLDNILNHPLNYETLKEMFVKHKQIKNPFTREEIKRIIKVKILI
jgi:hypothetical protein